MQQTQNYNLNKPDRTDYAIIDALNTNADIIDAKLKELDDNGDLTEIQQSISNLDSEVTKHLDEIATIDELGHIKPDGETITVDPVTGVASANGVSSHTIDYKVHTPYVPTTHTVADNGTATISVELEGVTELYEGLSVSFKVPVKTNGINGYYLNVNDLGKQYIITTSQGLFVGQTVSNLSATIITVRYSGQFWVIQGNPRAQFTFTYVTPWTGWIDGSNLEVAKDLTNNIVYVRGVFKKTAQSTQILGHLPEGFRPRAGYKIPINIFAPTGTNYTKLSGGQVTEDGMIMFLVLADVTGITNAGYVYVDFSFTMGY